MSASTGRFSRGVAVAAALTLAVVAAPVAGAAIRHTTAPKAVAAQITVTFTDRAMKVSSTTPQAGTTTFVVVNHGKKGHVLTVKGPGVKGAHTATIAAGKQAKLTVKLKSGTYMLADPVGLGAYAVQFVDVIPATSVSSGGGDSVTGPTVTLPPMCGGPYTP